MYDINTETKAGQKRLRKVFKVFSRYLIQVQKSVFEGEISEASLEKLKVEIRQEINNKVDSVIFFKSREERWLQKEQIGIIQDNTNNFV